MKRTAIIIVVVLVALLACHSLRRAILGFKYHMDVYEITDVGRLKGDFRTAAEGLRETFRSESADKDIKALSVRYDVGDDGKGEGRWVYSFTTDAESDGEDREWSAPSELDLSEKEKDALDRIMREFDLNPGGLGAIYVSDREVRFSSLTFYDYNVIYVTDGISPSASSDEYYIDMVSWKLFQIIKKD